MTGERLAVSDQGQRLQKRSRVPHRSLLPKPRHDLRMHGSHLYPPAAGDLCELDPAALVTTAQVREPLANLGLRGTLRLLEELRDLRNRQRAAGRQQDRFKYVGEGVFAHGSIRLT